MLCLLNPRKPEQADELLDKMRDLHDITQEVDTTLIDTAEEEFENGELEDLMKELDENIEKEDAGTAAGKTSGLPDAPETTVVAETATEPKKLPEVPIADPVILRPPVNTKVSVLQPQPTCDNADKDLEDMLKDL